MDQVSFASHLESIANSTLRTCWAGVSGSRRARAFVVRKLPPDHALALIMPQSGKRSRGDFGSETIPLSVAVSIKQTATSNPTSGFGCNLLFASQRSEWATWRIL